MSSCLREPALLHPAGQEDPDWELHVESLDDLAIVWKPGASVFVQVKNERLNATLLDAALAHWSATAPAGLPTALRVHALAGCVDKLRPMPSDLDQLRSLMTSAVAGPLKTKALADLVKKYSSVKRPFDERLTIDTRAARLDPGGRMLFADALRKLDDTRLVSRTSSDAALDALTARLVHLLLERGWMSRAQVQETLARAVISRMPLDPLAYYEWMDPAQPSNGYIVNPEARAGVHETQALVGRAARRALSRHRRRSWRMALKNVFTGGYDKCPNCGHPAMANFAGVGHRGTACPDCGWQKDMTLVVACSCHELVVIADQPPLDLERLGELLTRFVSTPAPHCSCGRALVMEEVRTRWFLIPLAPDQFAP